MSPHIYSFLLKGLHKLDFEATFLNYSFLHGISHIYTDTHVNKYLLVFLLLIWLLVQVPQPRTQKFRGRIALPLLHISFWAMVCKQKWHESLQAAVGHGPAGPPFSLPGAPATLDGELLHHSGSWREKTGQRPQPVPMSIWCTWKMKPGCLSPWGVLGFISLLLLQHNLTYPGWYSNTSCCFSQHFLKTTYSYMMVYIQEVFWAPTLNQAPSQALEVFRKE